MDREESLVNLFDYAAAASARLPSGPRDYIAGGAADEVTLGRTRDAWNGLLLRPRMLSGVTAADPATEILGSAVQLPVMLAPGGAHGVVHPDGELATVRAAGRLGAATIVSSGASYTLEDIAAAASGPLWFQQYLYRDRGLTLGFAARAHAAGYRALCITVDGSHRSKRERSIRTGYAIPVSPNYRRPGLTEHTWTGAGGPAAGGVQALIDPGATWPDIAWLAAAVPLPIVVKGVLTAADALAAADHGAAGVVVSNHGARQLDTTYVPVEALPEVVAAVGDRVEVYVDGGVRRGTDVVKAVAIGARAVLVGRPVYWGLAVDGQAGLERLLTILRDELVGALVMCGCAGLRDLTPGLVALARPLPRPLSDASRTDAG